jgi:hypothetical protein
LEIGGPFSEVLNETRRVLLCIFKPLPNRSQPRRASRFEHEIIACIIRAKSEPRLKPCNFPGIYLEVDLTYNKLDALTVWSRDSEKRSIFPPLFEHLNLADGGLNSIARYATNNANFFRPQLVVISERRVHNQIVLSTVHCG